MISWIAVAMAGGIAADPAQALHGWIIAIGAVAALTHSYTPPLAWLDGGAKT